MYPIKYRKSSSRPMVSLAYKAPGNYKAGFHTGVDFQPKRRGHHETIRAVKGGSVVDVSYDREFYGHNVTVRCHHNGRVVYVRYCHLDSVYRNIRVGRRIHTGAIIGKMGSTGNATGVHLHLEHRHEPGGYNDHMAAVLLTGQRAPARLRALGWR